MDWFPYWLNLRLAQCSPAMFAALPGGMGDSPITWTSSLAEIWSGVAGCLREQQLLSIDDIVTRLVDLHLLAVQDTASSPDGLDAARALVFALIGWQTMLYQYDSGSSPLSELKIENEMGRYQGQSRMILKLDTRACRRKLPDMLIRFGLMLPPANFGVSSHKDSSTAKVDLKFSEPDQLNASLLHSVTGIELKWTDSLSCHLEFDQANDVLFLFRYPSFCAKNLAEASAALEDGIFTPIYACAVPDDIDRPWATTHDVKQLLRETLLSYRLLFGQSKQSRRIFRAMNPFQGMAEQCHDPLLADLCGRKQCPSELPDSQRESYKLARDFPVLSERLMALEDFLAAKKPRSWIQLWKDKRDSGQWYTFWAVLFIGSLSVLLALVQVILQIIQIAV